MIIPGEVVRKLGLDGVSVEIAAEGNEIIVKKI